MPDYRHIGTHWPANAGGEHPNRPTIYALPGSRALILMLADSARFWYQEARQKSDMVVWRGLPRPDKLPAHLDWKSSRVADEVMNLWDEQPHSGLEWFLSLNELQFVRENGADFPGYSEMASNLKHLRIELQKRFTKLGQNVRLIFPAWVPGDDIEHADEWVDEAQEWDAVCLHAYDNAQAIKSRYASYRAILGAETPILVGEYNANHTGADEYSMVRMAAEICAKDANCLGWVWYIWETQNAGEQDLSIWGNQERLNLFFDPPVLGDPMPPPDEPAKPTPAPTPGGNPVGDNEMTAAQMGGQHVTVDQLHAKRWQLMAVPPLPAAPEFAPQLGFEGFWRKRENAWIGSPITVREDTVTLADGSTAPARAFSNACVAWLPNGATVLE